MEDREHSPASNTAQRRRLSRTSLTNVAFVAPALILVIGVLVYPIIHSMWLSIQVSEADGGTSVGIDNYTEVFTDPLFPISFRNTMFFALIAVGGSTVIGLFIALTLNAPSPLRALGRVAMLLPWSMSQVGVAVIWGWIYNGSYGALNATLTSLGVIDKYHSWLTEGTIAFLLLSVAFVWSIAPYAALLFLSGLQAIPPEQYESAKVDGAGPVQRLRNITLPWLRSSFLVVLVIASLEGFLAFTLIYVLTHGGPGNETTVLAWWGYSTTFTYGDVGQGAAILYFLTLLVMAASLLYMRVFRRPIT